MTYKLKHAPLGRKLRCLVWYYRKEHSVPTTYRLDRTPQLPHPLVLALGATAKSNIPFLHMHSTYAVTSAHPVRTAHAADTFPILPQSWVTLLRNWHYLNPVLTSLRAGSAIRVSLIIVPSPIITPEACSKAGRPPVSSS